MDYKWQKPALMGALYSVIGHNECLGIVTVWASVDCCDITNDLLLVGFCDVYEDRYCVVCGTASVTCIFITEIGRYPTEWYP